jgi:hypothetical protein
MYRILQTAWLRGFFSTIGALRLRALMLVILLTIVFVPLRSGLMQLKNEVIARTVVQEAITALVSREAVVAQQVQYNQEGVDISILSAQLIRIGKIDSARALIESRTREKAYIQVREVSSRSDLTDLLDRLTPFLQPLIPKPLAMTLIESDVLSRLKLSVDEIWPAKMLLLSYELVFSPDGLVVHFRYQARAALD